MQILLGFYLFLKDLTAVARRIQYTLTLQISLEISQSSNMGGRLKIQSQEPLTGDGFQYHLTGSPASESWFSGFSRQPSLLLHDQVWLEKTIIKVLAIFIVVGKIKNWVKEAQTKNTISLQISEICIWNFSLSWILYLFPCPFCFEGFVNPSWVIKILFGLFE